MPTKYRRRPRKEYDINIRMVSEWANYSSPNSLYNSTAKRDVLGLVDSVIVYMEDFLVNHPECIEEILRKANTK